MKLHIVWSQWVGLRKRTLDSAGTSAILLQKHYNSHSHTHKWQNTSDPLLNEFTIWGTCMVHLVVFEPVTQCTFWIWVCYIRSDLHNTEDQYCRLTTEKHSFSPQLLKMGYSDYFPPYNTTIRLLWLYLRKIILKRNCMATPTCSLSMPIVVRWMVTQLK